MNGLHRAVLDYAAHTMSANGIRLTNELYGCKPTNPAVTSEVVPFGTTENQLLCCCTSDSYVPLTMGKMIS